MSFKEGNISKGEYRNIFGRRRSIEEVWIAERDEVTNIYVITQRISRWTERRLRRLPDAFTQQYPVKVHILNPDHYRMPLVWIPDNAEQVLLRRRFSLVA